MNYEINHELKYTQDDCAPDSFDYFHKKFHEITGYNFSDWYNNIATKQSTPEDTVTYSCPLWVVTLSSHDPYWKLYKILNDEQTNFSSEESTSREG